MRIYLADLGHNLLTRSSDTYPLGVANLATYATAALGPSTPLRISLFREPQDLKAALDREAPDLLGLSSYAWNEALSCDFARYARRRHPGTLTVMGGPNFPLVPDVQAEFLRRRPHVDVFVNGPTYEGERAFVNLLRRLAESGLHRDGLFEAPVAGLTWIDPGTGGLVTGPQVDRIQDLDEIPSPYLEGWMDPFLTTGYLPLLQIARGCPFSCTFCNSGVESNRRIYAHSVENVKADLLYLAERVRPEIALSFADDNFGMYARDEEIADYLGWLQEAYHWPRYIRTTTGKNNSERIIRVMRKTHGALPMTAAVQSMTPRVLAKIKRHNVKLETYRAIQAELDRQGMQSYGELILCLPGESRETFMDGVRRLIEAGAKRISAHQLMLLQGAELANPDVRRAFQFDTRFRVVARNVGNYTGEPVIEVEEMVVATPTFSLHDYFETRVFHLLLTIYHYEGNYEEAIAFAAEHGVTPFDLVVRLQRMLGGAPEAMRAVVDRFLEESREELFLSREACLAWARAHYADLVSGAKGGNLLSKYSLLGRFYATSASLEFLRAGIAAAIGAARGFSEEALRDVIVYLEAVTLHVPFADTMATPARWTSRYDVQRWMDDRRALPLSAYALDRPRRFEAAVSPATRVLMETNLATFGEHPSGLGKFTRSLFARSIRRSVTREPPTEKGLVS